MPRRPRLVLPHVPQHIIQRGNNRTACFYADEDYVNYLDWLKPKFRVIWAQDFAQVREILGFPSSADGRDVPM
jgi:REP element-mobilizing transposase RayT